MDAYGLAKRRFEKSLFVKEVKHFQHGQVQVTIPKVHMQTYTTIFQCLPELHVISSRDDTRAHTYTRAHAHFALQGALPGQKIHFSWSQQIVDSVVPFGVPPGAKFVVKLSKVR